MDNDWRKGLKDNWLVLALPLAAFTLTVLAFFPGEMSPDSLDQLQQARMGAYGDWYPPIMAAFWRFLMEYVWDSPAVLFVFHNLLFWTLWAALAAAAFGDWKRRLVIFALGLLPSVWSQAIVLWKDTECSICLMAAYLCATGVMVVPEKEKGRWRMPLLVLTGLFSLYGVAVRYNALPAFLPLLWFLLPKKEGRPFLKKALATALAMVVAWGWVWTLDYGILRAQKQHIIQAPMAHDIAGIFARTGQSDVLPPYWSQDNPSLKPEDIRRLYVATNYFPLYSSRLLMLTDFPNKLRELRRCWFRDVVSHPAAYLSHRWAVFRGLLRIGESESYYPVQMGMAPNNLGLEEMGPPSLREALKGYFLACTRTWFFMGWFYVVLLLVLLGINWNGWNSDDPWRRASFFSALSAVFYLSGYFLAAPTCDFRFLYPAITLCLFSGAAYWVGRTGSASPPTS